MPERPNPETLKQFWEGHSLQDNCPTKDYDPGSIKDSLGCLLIIPAAVEMIALQSRISREDRVSIYQLRAWLAARTGGPIRTLQKGDTFKLSEFTKGTIVRFSCDQQGHFMEQPYSGVRWGILTETKDRYGRAKDVVISFEEVQLKSGSNSNFSKEVYNDKEIGVVLHTKEKTSPITADQNLERFSWVEIWQFGKEVRERQNSPQSFLGRILKPGSK